MPARRAWPGRRRPRAPAGASPHRAGRPERVGRRDPDRPAEPGTVRPARPPAGPGVPVAGRRSAGSVRSRDRDRDRGRPAGRAGCAAGSTWRPGCRTSRPPSSSTKPPCKSPRSTSGCDTSSTIQPRRTSAFPAEAERVTNWVGIHPVVRALVRQPRSADLECRLFGHLDVVHHDIDVKLLRTLRIRPPWFSKIRHSLEGKTMAVGVVSDHDPSIALALYPHAQQPHVELRQGPRVRAINHRMFETSDHSSPLTHHHDGISPPRPPDARDAIPWHDAKRSDRH
jgi:hypothetical protein